MTNAYFDASALVSLFVGDTFGERTESYIERYAPTILVSDFVAVEFASAIGKLVRTGQLSTSNARTVFSDFSDWRRGSTRHISLGSNDLADAEGFLRRLDFNLRTGDAIHLAIARRSSSPLVTFDQKMAQVAVELGIEVATV